MQRQDKSWPTDSRIKNENDLLVDEVSREVPEGTVPAFSNAAIAIVLVGPR